LTAPSLQRSTRIKENVMTHIQRLWTVIVLLVVCSIGRAQQHFADGSRHFRGNRLVSVKSGPGRQLHRPDGRWITREIHPDAKIAEADWKDAQTAGPFRGEEGQPDPTRVRVLYDRENIYLCWEVEETKDLTANVEDDDVPITGDDDVRIDLKPIVPDKIQHGRDYYYSIAVNPNGAVWDTHVLANVATVARRWAANCSWSGDRSYSRNTEVVFPAFLTEKPTTNVPPRAELGGGEYSVFPGRGAISSSD
jgi:hypothetical protein